MPEAPGEFTVSIGNILLGVYRFLTLPLPPGWVVHPGELGSEVSYTAERNGVRWVTDGEAHHYVASALGDARFQLSIRIRQARALPQLRARRVRNWRHLRRGIGTHEAQVLRGDRVLGLLGKRTMPYLRVVFNCDRTGRQIDLEMQGQGAVNALDTFLDTLTSVRCH